MTAAALPLRHRSHENDMDEPPKEPTTTGTAATALPSASEGLDAASLARLRELDPSGTGHLLERVFQAFEASLARLMPALLQAQGAGDLPGIRHVAHTLKSSSASIGALRLAQLCAEIEHMIRQGDADLSRLSPLIEQMRAEMAAVLRALAQVLDGS